jgi:hypothetical protein
MGMDDTKLLELAGIASGEKFDAENNPLERDDLALRLAVKLGFIVVIDEEMKWCGIHHSGNLGKYDAAENFNEDRYAATRRAIVRAAAAAIRSRSSEG